MSTGVARVVTERLRLALAKVHRVPVEHPDVFRSAPSHVIECIDPASGLHAVLVIDDTTLGPAVGGIRTRRYESPIAAREDALALARAMSIKCAIGGLAAGGGKCVVIEDALVDRAAAFRELGARIEALGGLFRTAGDFGTTDKDLEAVASRTRFVHRDEGRLAAAVGTSTLRAIEACAAFLGVRDGESLAGVSVAVQGAGAIGSAVTRALRAAGAHVIVADLDEARAQAVAYETGAHVAPAETILEERVDVVAPCALGGAITVDTAARLRAGAVCGAANNVLAGDDAARELERRGIVFVPDVLASAGAVVDGISRSVMHLDDTTPMLDAIFETTLRVLREARTGGKLPSDVVRELGESRIAAARRASSQEATDQAAR